MKARRIPGEALIFSPQWKTQEAEFYTKWRMATVAAVATRRHTLFTSAAKESNQKATVFLLPIPGPPQEGNAYSRWISLLSDNPSWKNWSRGLCDT